MISYGKQSIDKSDIDAVISVLKGDRLTQGPAIDIFENDFLHFGQAQILSNSLNQLNIIFLPLNMPLYIYLDFH